MTPPLPLATRRTFFAAGAAVCAGTACSAPSGGSAGPAATPSPGSPPGALVALADVPVGSAVAATGPDGPVLVARTGETEVVAFSARCTHQGCTVSASGACPCHGSQFDPLTGEVQEGPADAPLPPLAVQVVDGQVVPA